MIANPWDVGSARALAHGGFQALATSSGASAAAVGQRSFPVAALEAAGVRRISLAGSLYRVAMRAMSEAAREVLDSGTFSYVERG